MRRSRVVSIAAGVALCGLAWPLVAGVRPNLVLEGGRPGLDLDEFPPGTERLEIDAGGDTLVGVFVPSDPGAPVVAHFLEARGSVTLGARAGLDNRDRGHGVVDIHYPVLLELADLGFASVMVDYAGVGASSGARASENVARDARAVYEEALRRAGDDSERVVLRGTSLGSLAVATLLADDVEPAAVLLHAPVRAETVAVRYVGRRSGDLAALLTRTITERPIDVDLIGEIARAEAPVMLTTPQRDSLLAPAEQKMMKDALAGEHDLFRRAAPTHRGAAIAAHRLADEEEQFLRGLFPSCPPVGRRMEALTSMDGGGEWPEEVTARVRDVVAEKLVRRPAWAVAIARRRPAELPVSSLDHWITYAPIEERSDESLLELAELRGVDVDLLDELAPFGGWLATRALVDLIDPSKRGRAREGSIAEDAVDKVLRAHRRDRGDSWSRDRVLKTLRKAAAR